MANYDNPNGFKPARRARVTPYTASATITKGDLLAIDSGKVLPYSSASHDEAIGVAATPAVNGGECLVYDDPTTTFIGQTSGSYTPASDDGELCGVEGTTGIMEVDENGTQKLLKIVRHRPQTGSTETGANSRVEFSIVSHTLSPSAGPVADIDNDGDGYTHLADLTDSSGGSTDGTIEAVGATNSGDVSGAINNNFAEVAAKIAAIHARLEAAGISASS